LLTRVDLAGIATALGRSDVRYVALALLVVTSAHVPAALAWKRLTDVQGLRLTVVRVHLLYALGMFFASFTPGGLGSDVVRTLRLQQSTNRGVEAAVSVLAARLLSLVALVVIVVPASLTRERAPVPTSVTVALVVLLVGVLVLGVFRETVFALGKRVVPFLTSPLRMVGAALGAFRRAPAALIAAGALLAAHHLLAAASLGLLTVAVGAHVGFADVLALGLLARLVAFLPISVGGVGVYEAGVVLLLGSVGVPPSDAVAVAILQRAVEIAVPLAGGVVYVAGWSGQRGKVAQREPALPQP
jgi:uncharacterized membrane protein YbhN (UPF0104 family)